MTTERKEGSLQEAVEARAKLFTDYAHDCGDGTCCLCDAFHSKIRDADRAVIFEATRFVSEQAHPVLEGYEAACKRWDEANAFECTEHGPICSNMVRHVLAAYGVSNPMSNDLPVASGQPEDAVSDLILRLRNFAKASEDDGDNSDGWWSCPKLLREAADALERREPRFEDKSE